MTTITKQASEHIKELGISLKTEKKWERSYTRVENYETRENKVEVGDWHTVENIVQITTGQEVFEWWYKDVRKIEKNWFPAPNLQELFLALEEIGEKLGWKTYKARIGSGEIWDFQNAEKAWKQHVPRLTDSFLKGGMEGVSEEIINLISKK